MRIPRANRRVGLNPTSTPYSTANVAAPAQAMQSVAGGIQKVANGVDRWIEADIKEREKLDDFQTKIALTRFQADQERQQTSYDQAISGDGRNHTAGRLESYDQASNALIQTLPNNDRTQQQAKLFIERSRANYGSRSHKTQLGHISTYKANAISETVTGSLLPSVTGEYETAATALGVVDQIVSQTDGIRAQDKEALKRQATRAVLEAWVSKAGVDGLEQAKALVANGEAAANSNKPTKTTKVLTSGRKRSASGWARNNKVWAGLDGFEKAAVMSLMEADGMDADDAKNALGAMINRAAKSGEHLGAHVSNKIYQPTIEPAQERRLNRILKSKHFETLTEWAKRRAQGLESDPVKGATHFLAPGHVMEALERKNPRKYHNWGPRGSNWTGYSYKTKRYKNQTHSDKSHAFLAPEGAYSVSENAIQSEPDVALREGNPHDQGPQLPQMSLQDFRWFSNLVDSANKKLITRKRFELGELADADVASVRETGTPVGGFDFDEYAKVATPRKLERYVQRRKEAEAEFKAIDGMAEMSIEDIHARVEGLKPVPGSSDFDDENTVYERADRKARDLLRLRERDPAEAVAKSQEVQDARANLDKDKPETVQRLIKARIAAQDRLGIPSHMVRAVTQREARLIAGPIKAASEIDQFDVLEKTYNSLKVTHGAYADEALTSAIELITKSKDRSLVLTEAIKGFMEDDEKAAKAALDQAGELKDVEAQEEAVGSSIGVMRAWNWITGDDEEVDTAVAAKEAEKRKAFPKPSQAAIEALQANPDKLEEFEKLFGPGAGDQALEALANAE